jgi:hypothetical protein
MAPAVAGAQTSGCGSSLQSLVDAAPPGSTLTAPACVYRETITIAKPLTLIGSAGSEIRGSDVWSAWDLQNGLWTSEQVVPSLPVVSIDPNACDGDSGGRCLWPQQVFLDGSALQPAGPSGSVAPGMFGLDAVGHVVLADDPSGHLVEVTTRPRWIVTSADGVTIQGFAMRHAGNGAAAGAISNDGRSRWTLQDSSLSDAHAADVSLEGGTDVRVLRNDISRAGLVGIAGSQVNYGGLIQGNKIHENSRAGFSLNWGAGGLKLTHLQDFVVDGNEAAYNNGVGLWCDIGCSNVSFSNNRVHHNQWQGINFEISDGASIHGNTTWENGWGKPFWGWGAGIVISSSANAEVFDNVAAWNYAGISVLYQSRPSSPGPDPAGNYVHDNVIVKKTVTGDFSQTYWQNLSLAWISDGSQPMMFDPSWGNHGANNSVWYDLPEDTAIRFSWTTQYMTLPEFTDTPGGAATRYLTSAEKDEVLALNGVPLTPEH